jgi:hypothetical protein
MFVTGEVVSALGRESGMSNCTVPYSLPSRFGESAGALGRGRRFGLGRGRLWTPPSFALQ